MTNEARKDCPAAILSISALRHNLNKVKMLAQHTKVMAVIKADAYGHGILAVAKALRTADAFAVARLDEALLLRNAGVEKKILVLSGVNSVDAWAQCAELKLDVVVHDPVQIETLRAAKCIRPIHLWLKVDTGMHRLGFAPEQARNSYETLCAMAGKVASLQLMSHLASADNPNDPYTALQQRTFDAIDINTTKSLANSAGIFTDPALHYDWVRPGIMLYGASPIVDKTGPELDLQPVMTLQTRLIATHQLRKGDPVGYSRTWVCPENMLVGVAAIGYGDGYPRHVQAGTPVLVNGAQAQLIGQVSMDLITLDLRRVPQVKVGDCVTLWGQDLSVNTIADCAKTISYTLLCSVTRRVPRIWVD